MLFRAPHLDEIEIRVLEEVQRTRESLRYAMTSPQAWYGLLQRSTLARAISATNSIEGYEVSVSDVIAAIEHEEPLDAEDENRLTLLGTFQAMSYVLRLAEDPHFTHYSVDLVRSLHFMMLGYDVNKHPGTWRPGWIGIHDTATDKLVYEGPDAEAIPTFMQELIDFLNEDDDQTPIVKAALAHLNLVMIHPFSDGNGRMARCLQTLVLGKSVGVLSPQFASIEEYLRRNRTEYYAVLAEVGQGSWQPLNDTRPWIRFCLRAHYTQAHTLLRRARQWLQLWNELDEIIEEHGWPERMKYALSDAANGLAVRNSTYRPVADVSSQVASRDLALLVGARFLEAHGEKRGRFYTATAGLKALFDRVRLPKMDSDPFADESVGPMLPGLDIKDGQ